MTLQTRDLVMVPLGTDGLYQDVEEGVHLRWQMDVAIGFPPYGFDVFRRPHRPPSLILRNLQTRPNGFIDLGDTFRALRFRLRLAASSGETIGQFTGSTMVSIPLFGSPGSEQTIDLVADAIDQVILPAGTIVLQAWGAPASQEAQIGWGAALNHPHRIGLPLTDNAYPVRHPHAPDDWAEASERLGRRTAPNGPIAVPPELATRHGGQNFQDLLGLLRHLGANGPSPFPVMTAGASTPRIQLDPAGLAHLLAIDPNFARILGLLWVDRMAIPGIHYDYKVIGYWSPGTAASQVSCTDFGTITPGTVLVPGTVLTLEPKTGTTTPGVPGTDTHAMRGRDSSISSVAESVAHVSMTVNSIPENRIILATSPWGAAGLDLIGLSAPPWRLKFDRSIDGVNFSVSRPNAGLQIIVYNADGKKLDVAAEQKDIAGEFSEIHIVTPGIATIEVYGPRVTVYQVCVVTQVVTGDAREWICFGVARGAAIPLEPPQALTATAVPRIDPDDKPLLQPSAISGQHGLAAALTWQVPEETSAVLSKNPVAYHVYRYSLGNGGRPAQSPQTLPLSSFDRLTEDRSELPVVPMPAKPSRREAPRSRPTGWPATPVHFVDGNARDRWYAYAVQGIDIFGRLSTPAITVADLKDLVPPPPPEGVKALFIDPAVGPGDPNYVPGLNTFVPPNADGLLMIEWDWPSARYRQAPDIAEFRIYWQPSRLNTLGGNIVSVINRGDTSNVTVALDSGQLAQRMTDGWLRSGVDFFKIIGSTTGTSPVVTVQNLRITRSPDEAPTPPSAGACMISIGGGDASIEMSPDPNFRDYRNPTSWASRAAVVTAVQPLEGNITSVAFHSFSGELSSTSVLDYGDGTYSIRLEHSLRKAEGVLRGGTLVIDNKYKYKILSNSDGPVSSLLVQGPTLSLSTASGPYILEKKGVHEVVTDILATALPKLKKSLELVGGTLVTPTGEYVVISVYTVDDPPRLALAVLTDANLPPLGPCAWFPGYRLGLVPSPALSLGVQAIASGAVGVSAADGRDYVADVRGDPQHVGNESAVSAPQIVIRQRRAPVPAPAAPLSNIPAGQQHIYSTVPNYYARSFYTLMWSASPGTAYLVYRALDQAVFLRDREQRRTMAGYYAGRTPFDDDTGFQSWFTVYSATVPGLTLAQLTAPESSLIPTDRQVVAAAWEAWAEHFYPSLIDTALQALANRAGNEAAFVRLNSAPISGASYKDTLDGRAPSRFLYRLRAVDVAGNESPPGPSSLPVYVPVVLPPPPPRLLEAAGGVQLITLRWIANEEADLDYYILYRATSADDASDIRAMALHARIAKNPIAVLRAGEVAPAEVANAPGRLEFEDEDHVEAGITYYYRMLAVSTNAVRSEPSSAVSGKAYKLPPAPPDLALPVWDANHMKVNLTWSSPDTKLECLVERRIVGKQTWLSVSGWLARGVYSYTDSPPDPNLRYEYRIRVRDELGQSNTTYQTQVTV
jgi:hypothetical protein